MEVEVEVAVAGEPSGVADLRVPPQVGPLDLHMSDAVSRDPNGALGARDLGVVDPDTDAVAVPVSDPQVAAVGCDPHRPGAAQVDGDGAGGEARNVAGVVGDGEGPVAVLIRRDLEAGVRQLGEGGDSAAARVDAADIEVLPLWVEVVR